MNMLPTLNGSEINEDRDPTKINNCPLITPPRLPLSQPNRKKANNLLNLTDFELDRLYKNSIDALVRASIIRPCKPGSHILRGDVDSNSIFYLIEGTVTQYMMDTDGNEIVFNYLTPGNLIGVDGICHSEGNLDLWVSAKTECTVGEISYSRFQQLSTEYPALITMLLTQITESAITHRRRLYGTVFMKITDKVRNVLASLIYDNSTIDSDDGYIVCITRYEISRIVGCSREMVGRVLKELQDSNFLLMHGNKRRITIYKDALQDLI